MLTSRKKLWKRCAAVVERLLGRAEAPLARKQCGNLLRLRTDHGSRNNGEGRFSMLQRQEEGSNSRRWWVSSDLRYRRLVDPADSMRYQNLIKIVARTVASHVA